MSSIFEIDRKRVQVTPIITGSQLRALGCKDPNTGELSVIVRLGRFNRAKLVAYRKDVGVPENPPIGQDIFSMAAEVAQFLEINFRAGHKVEVYTDSAGMENFGKAIFKGTSERAHLILGPALVVSGGNMAYATLSWDEPTLVVDQSTSDEILLLERPLTKDDPDK